MPDVGPISGRIDIVDSVGELTVAGDAMPLHWPALADTLIEVDSLKAAIDLDLRNSQRLTMAGDIVLLDDGINLSTRLKATVVPGQSPHLDVQSRYSVDDITALKQWLPRSLMAPGLQSWLDSAFRGGSVSNGSLLLFGRLSEFPFDEGEGVFRISVDLDDAELQFLPDWPSLKAIDGQVELNGLMLTGAAQSSTLDQFDVSTLQIRIDDLVAPILTLSGSSGGPVSDILAFGSNGPLEDILGPVLSDISGTGTADLDLNLSYQIYKSPIDGSFPFSLDGAFFMAGNTVAFDLADIELQQVRGAIGFDLNGIRINNLRAKALDQPVTIDAYTNGLGSAATTHIVVDGALRGSEILAHYENPLDQFVRGTSRWNIELSAPHSADRIASEGVGLRVTSDLVGTQLILPVPLNKGTGESQPFELSTSFRTDESPSVWDVRYANSLHVNAMLVEDELESVKIYTGAESMPPAFAANTDPGIQLQGRVPALSVDGWVESISQLIDTLSDESEDPELILPVFASLSVDAMLVGRQNLSGGVLSANTDQTYLNIAVTNPTITGSLRYPREHWSRETAMRVRIDEVDDLLISALQTIDDTAVDQLLSAAADDDDALDPRLLPPIEARINRFTYGEQTLRDVVLRGQPDVSGISITTLGFAYQTMQLVGQGYWHLIDPQGVNAELAGKHATKLNLVLKSDDFGEGLAHIGLHDVISDGEGTIEAQLSWDGPAYKPELAELDGSIKIRMERGSIVPLEPAAGRIVGLFALQALPRRLDLDFKDVTSDGLAFKSISGDIDIEDGIANVNLVQLNGPIGVVDVTGRSDLNAREFDQRITVLPRVSAALPIIGVISGGASAGIGALVATGILKVLGIDLDRIGLRDFSLTGTWDKPVFQSEKTDYSRRR